MDTTEDLKTKKSAPGRDWLSHVAKSHNSQASNAKNDPPVLLVVFALGRELYGVPIESVKEVVRMPKLAPLPQAPDYMLGVGNIRGDVLAIVDLEKRLKTGTNTRHTEEAFVMVIKDEVIKAALVVPTVPDTLTFRKSQISTSSAVIKNLSADEAFITGIVKREKDMIIMIDAHKMFDETVQ